MAHGDPRMAERRSAIVPGDDEPAVHVAVAGDLRRGFGERYRILRAGSGPGAVENLWQVLRRRDHRVPARWLDVERVAVDRHDVSLRFDSRPGRTAVRGSLPLTQSAS